MRLPATASLPALLLALAAPAAAPAAEPAGALIPAGSRPDLDAAMARQGRAFHALNAYPFGLSLNVHVRDAAARAKVEAFLAQDAVADFEAFDGTHQHSLMTGYGEHGDLGFFGGVALVGTAFRYMTLKRDGAPPEVLAEARERVVRAARAWHLFYVVTGGKGVVARGIVRLVPEDPADPPFPEAASWVATPLADAQGGPLPAPKDNGTYRADNSGGALPPGEWGWIDSASKDQVVGQVLGLVCLHDALAGDPDVDPALVEQLRADALGLARMLMTKHEISGLEGPIGAGEYDMIIFDADGRPTYHHDLNPASLEKLFVPEGSPQFNVFNLFMAIGVMEGLFHVTGDPDVEAFLYDELLGRRGWLDKAASFDGPDAFNYIYLGRNTNTDNPDMTAVALFLTLWSERDEGVTSVIRRFLEDGWWAPATEPRFCASRSKQPLWHAIYLAVTDRGTPAELRDELARLLAAFPLGAYWQDPRINCDADEIAKGSCLAIDGKTVIELAGTTADGDVVATEALDPSIRPNSDFNARSNPFRVNGGGDGLLLNPGGDLQAAYWVARYVRARVPGEVQPSALARAHRPVPGTAPLPEPSGDVPADANPDAAPADAPAGNPEPGAASRGGSCASGATAPAWVILAVLAASAAASPRRRNPRSP